MKHRAPEDFNSRIRKYTLRAKLAFAGIVLGVASVTGSAVCNEGYSAEARDYQKSAIKTAGEIPFLLGGAALVVGGFLVQVPSVLKLRKLADGRAALADGLAKEVAKMERFNLERAMIFEEFDRRKEMLSAPNKYCGIRDLYKHN